MEYFSYLIARIFSYSLESCLVLLNIYFKTLLIITLVKLQVIVKYKNSENIFNVHYFTKDLKLWLLIS